jgi:uncharacterized protein
MKLEQSFTVDAPVDQVWAALIDVERIAPCLPGAEIAGQDESGAYEGTFSVKLGPTTAAYRGSLQMEAVDEAARTATMSAKGTDKRGQGGASATIVSTMREEGGTTHVDVLTDFHITGRLARFGRSGMIEDISRRLMRDFAECLQSTIGATPGVAAPAAAASGPAAPAAATAGPTPPDEAAASAAPDDADAALASAGGAAAAAASAGAAPPGAGDLSSGPAAPAEPPAPSESAAGRTAPSEPPAAEPLATASGAAAPAPAPSEPARAEPARAEPARAEPAPAEPAAADPAAAEPPPAEPVAAEPEAPEPRTGSVPPPGRPESPRPAATPAKPISGFSLFFSVLWERIKRVFSRSKT